MSTISNWRIALAILSAPIAASAQQYTLTDLGSLGGGGSDGFSINDAGQIVGFSYTTTSTTGNAPYEAFLYSNGVMTGLGMPGGQSSSAQGINNFGQIVGYSFDGVGSHALVWNGTTPTSLANLPGGGYSQATAVNDAGEIAGWAAPGSSPSGSHAVSWSGSGANPTDLTPQFPPGSAEALAINNSGTVVGQSNSSAVVWIGTSMMTLTPLAPGNSAAYAINNVGEIVGASTCCTGSSFHATLWEGTSTIDLGTLGGSSTLFGSRALGINTEGQVVGSSTANLTGVVHATLWDNGQIFDLNALDTGSPLAAHVTLSQAQAINDNGWIVAEGVNSTTGVTDAYLLQPVPLPAASWLLLSALGGLGAVTRRRFSA